jgi:hypothetical protein
MNLYGHPTYFQCDGGHTLQQHQITHLVEGYKILPVVCKHKASMLLRCEQGSQYKDTSFSRAE